jgi:hypothetical protein
MERVTSADPLDGKPRAVYRAMFRDGLDCILGTGGIKPAVIKGKDGGNGRFIETKEYDENGFHSPSLSLIPFSSFLTCV